MASASKPVLGRRLLWLACGGGVLLLLLGVLLAWSRTADADHAPGKVVEQVTASVVPAEAQAPRPADALPVVLFPADRQQDVPLHFSGGPELAGTVARQNAGFPITVMLPPRKIVTDVRASLTEQGRTVSYDVIKDRQFPGIGLLPRRPLKPNTTYRVDLTLRIDDGQSWHRTWTFTTCDDADTGGQLAQKAVARINEFRRAVDIPPVTLDPELSKGCRNHARYLVLNAENPAVRGLAAHNEQKHLPGFTPEGEKAGKGVIADGQHDPLAALDAWMATFYHRVPLLDPRLTRIGFGCALGQRHTWISVVDVASGRDQGSFKVPIVYPVHRQRNVPLCFSGNEVPNPIPDDRDGKAGYPVTVTFPERIERAAASFKDDLGREVPAWFSTPDRPANPRHAAHQGMTVCLMAYDPLRPNTTYQVQLAGEVQGRPWHYAWSFTTGAVGTSTADAAAAVLERINRYRAQAGLPKVALDQAAVKNCEAHARYLQLNAARISPKKFNDEDPQLPGFTPGGQAVARSAAVFFHAPEPTVQIDTMLACLQRSYLLDRSLRRIGFGCAMELGRGWVCVLDFSSGRDESVPVLLPAAEESDSAG